MARQMEQTYRLAHSYTSLEKVFIPQIVTPCIINQMSHAPIYSSRLSTLFLYNTKMYPYATNVQSPRVQDVNFNVAEQQSICSNLQYTPNSQRRTHQQVQQKTRNHHRQRQPKNQQQTQKTKVSVTTPSVLCQ